MNLISIRRGAMYDSTGAQLALHFWVGPFGLHVFRGAAAGVEPELDCYWRH
jgi:hypothetical protein